MQLGVGLGLPYNLGKPAAAFSPLDLSPVLWLDASDTSTITESGGAVSQWDDKSGNGNHVTQATAARQPSSGTRTLNSLNVVDFGGDDVVAGSTVLTTAVDDITMIIAIDADALTGFRSPFNNGGASTGYGIAQTADGTNIGWIQGGAGWRASTTASVTGSQILLWERRSGTVAMRQNAVAVSGVPQYTPITPAAYFSLGSSRVDTAWWNGAIAEAIFVDGTLSAGEIAATESYLASKWGITL